MLDLVEQESEYVPKDVYQFHAKELTPEEQSVEAQSAPVAIDEGEFVAKEDVW